MQTYLFELNGRKLEIARGSGGNIKYHDLVYSKVGNSWILARSEVGLNIQPLVDIFNKYKQNILKGVKIIEGE